MIIDVSAWVGDWPFARLGRTAPGGLSRAMRKSGVGLALVSPAEGICLQNPHFIIPEHFRRLESFPNMLPVPVINPLLHDAEKQLEYASARGAPAVRLCPNYHGYEPDCGEAVRIIELCGGFGMAVMFQTRVEDVRGQHRVMTVPDASLGRILDAAERHNKTTVVICGLNSVAGEDCRRIIRRRKTYIDTSFLECMDTLNAPQCTLNGNYARIMFATHTPFFYIGANIVKLEALRDRPEKLEMVSSRNAMTALGLRRRKNSGN